MKLGYEEGALDDFEKSLSLNHLNHTAYFNYSSAWLCAHEYDNAFRALCFALSSAYTLAARTTTHEPWVKQALYYSCNNKEALAMHALGIAHC